MEKVFTTQQILKELDECIRKQRPFSIIRFGDGVLGMLMTYFCPHLIQSGKWSTRRIANSVMNELTIPKEKRVGVLTAIIDSANNANFCDSFDAFKYLANSNLGEMASKWKEIHNQCGITNVRYCNPYVHYFSIVEGEFNLFDIMKDRRIFCISNHIEVSAELKIKSDAKEIATYKIPRRGRKGRHYLKHYKKIIDLIHNNATKYDLFLIGAGLLGKVYCGEVKKCGGRVFDSGRLFDLWARGRAINSRPKRFIRMDYDKMLAKRIRKDTTGIW